jgi:multimeric flavodoxin WrbA
VKVVGLVGSPRKQGNTDLVVSKILDGVESEGNLTEKVYLYDHEILPCTDCRACKKGDFQCVLKDDMRGVYPKLEAADVIVFGTLLYWYGATAKMKLFVDRLRPYIASRRLKTKKAVLVVPSEEGAKACLSLVDMFRCSFKYIEMELLSQVLVKAYEKGEVANHPDILAAAFQVGRALNKTV